MDTRIMKSFEDVLSSFGNKYYTGKELNKARIIQDIDRYDEKLIIALLNNALIKKHYAKQISDYTVIETNKIIETFEMDDYWMDSYTKYTKKVGLTANGRFLDESTDIALDFPYKDTVLKAGMSKEDAAKEDLLPNEPFFNEVIAAEEIDTLLDKKILVNTKRYTVNGVEEVEYFSEEDNIILKGNNLLALHSLKDTYRGKVKAIFIDPPYYFIDTKPSDAFLYNSNFKMSTWLVFMKNRLQIAYDLLSDNGILFMAISDDGAHYLKVLTDEIFDMDNFIADVTWESRTSISSDGLMSMNSNHILVYAKNKNIINKNSFRLALDIETFKYDDNDGRGRYRLEPFDAPAVRKNLEYEIINPNTGEIYLPPAGRHWRTKEDTYNKLLNENRIQFGSTGNTRPQLKAYYTDIANAGKGKAASSIWHDIENVNWFETNTNTSATKHLQSLFGYSAFSNPKPEELVQRALQLSTDENDIVLDFFMGSATTQAVAMKMKRRFIGIEQMDYITTVSVPRLQKVMEGEQGGISKDVNWQGGGSFVYAELMEKSKGYLQDVLHASNLDHLNAIYQLMLENVDLDFRADLESIQKMLEDTISLDDKKRLLIKVIDKNQLYYNYAEIDDANVRELINDSDYAFNQSFYKEEDRDAHTDS